MGSRSLERRQLSRSKLDLFLECPRCFHEDVAAGRTLGMAELRARYRTGKGKARARG